MEVGTRLNTIPFQSQTGPGYERNSEKPVHILFGYRRTNDQTSGSTDTTSFNLREFGKYKMSDFFLREKT